MSRKSLKSRKNWTNQRWRLESAEEHESWSAKFLKSQRAGSTRSETPSSATGQSDQADYWSVESADSAEFEGCEVMRKALKPAGQVDYQEMERLYGGCHCANRLSVIFIDSNIMRLVRIFAPYGHSSIWTISAPGRICSSKSRRPTNKR